MQHKPESSLAPLHYKKGGENLTQNRTHATSIILTEDLHHLIMLEKEVRNVSMSDVIREILFNHYGRALPQRRGAVRKGRRI
jgi:hypothetical protein